MTLDATVPGIALRLLDAQLDDTARRSRDGFVLLDVLDRGGGVYEARVEVRHQLTPEVRSAQVEVWRYRGGFWNRPEET